MPSPFPGMDPFIEGQIWPDFHHTLITTVREFLWPYLRPHYVIRVEERVYIERQPAGHRVIIPDVTVLETEDSAASVMETAGSTPVMTTTPVILTLPMPERKREAFLTVRERQSMAVIAVIEVLSLDNKRSGSDGRHEYLHKREAILESDVHLIELDLLRGGVRLPTVEELPPAAYYALVSRADHRPHVEVYPWTLCQRLPSIPVPLAGTTRMRSLISAPSYDRLRPCRLRLRP